MIATNASRARVLHDLAGLDVDVKSYEIAYARKRARDEKHELWVGLLVVIFATVVGSSIFATLSTSPATWIKVLIGCMSIASAILAAINQWAPFTGSSDDPREHGDRYGVVPQRHPGPQIRNGERHADDEDEIRRRSQLQLGAELMGQRRFAEALECFRRAYALGARGFLVDFGLGSALLDTDQDAAAIVELERAAALEPRHIGSCRTSARRSTTSASWTRRSPTSVQRSR